MRWTKLSGALAAATLFLLPLLLVSEARGRFRMPDEVPVDRLVGNVEKWVKAHPDDPRGHFLLGRLHSLALATKGKSLRVYPGRDEDSLPTIPKAIVQREQNEVTDEADLRRHLHGALVAFHRALELREGYPLYLLGYAYTLEEGAAVARSAPPPAAEVPLTTEQRHHLSATVESLAADDEEVREAARARLAAEGARAAPVLVEYLDTEDERVTTVCRELLTRLWREAALGIYLEVYEKTIDSDLEIESMPLAGVKALIAWEAGRGWVRLVERRGVREEERELLDEVKANLTRLEQKPRRMVTPVLVPLDRPRTLEELLAPGHVVAFDLDGDGLAERRPWVRPATGILVWDPSGRGEIRSGRQLFGSVTWWMFWEDGYQALRALDDDGDGRLAGPELSGLALWRDRDGDGRSDPGEVETLDAIGITSLGVRPDLRSGLSPGCSAGVGFGDGRVLPTWDWVDGPRGSEAR